MWASLWSFLTVIPVSGQVKYTPGSAMGRGFFGLEHHVGAWGLQPPIQSSFSSKFLSHLTLNGILCWESQGPELLMLKSTTAAAATICTLSVGPRLQTIKEMCTNDISFIASLVIVKNWKQTKNSAKI